jgi:hypothetical protein
VREDVELAAGEVLRAELGRSFADRADLRVSRGIVCLLDEVECFDEDLAVLRACYEL